MRYKEEQSPKIPCLMSLFSWSAKHFLVSVFIMAVGATLAVSVPSAAEAAVITVDVYAYNHSTNYGMGTGLDTEIDLQLGDMLRIEVDPMDSWSAGGGCHTSNADGHGSANPWGCRHPCYTIGNSTFLYGALVGRIGEGDYFLVGTAYERTVQAAGRLRLYYWDSYTGDNSGYVTATISINEARKGLRLPYNECVPDSDGDGVNDDLDGCSGTAAGAVVNENGCSIDQICPCSKDWRNHGGYVACVSHTAENFLSAGVITSEVKDAIMSAAGTSSCGHKK